MGVTNVFCEKIIYFKIYPKFLKFKLQLEMLKGTVMQLEKAHVKRIAYLFQKYPENFASQLFIILQQFTGEICHFLKKVAYSLTVCIVFSVYK